MENRAHALIAGLFLLLMGTALVAAIAWFQGDRTAQRSLTVVSRIGVPGLNVKAPVKLRGVEVGKVESIGFDPADPHQILIEIGVDERAPLTTGVYAELGHQGITGLSFLELRDESRSQQPLAAAAGGGAPRIELRPGLFERVADAGPALIAGFGEAATRINTLLGDENQRQLAKTLANLEQASSDVSRLVAELRPTAQALPRLARSADATVQRAGGVLANVDALVTDARGLSNDLRARSSALDRLGDAAAQLESTSRSLELALVGPERVRSAPLIEDIARGSRAVERVATEFGDQPHSLLFGKAPSPPGPGESGFLFPAGGAK